MVFDEYLENKNVGFMYAPLHGLHTILYGLLR